MEHLLFIDDDPSFVEEMKFLLEENGYRVTSANDGIDAFQLTKKQSFDLVITDVLMINSHGIEVILHMREFQPQAKIITITGGGGWASPQFHLDAARLFGSDGCLAKPFTIEMLIEEINRVLHH